MFELFERCKKNKNKSKTRMRYRSVCRTLLIPMNQTKQTNKIKQTKMINNQRVAHVYRSNNVKLTNADVIIFSTVLLLILAS